MNARKRLLDVAQSLGLIVEELTYTPGVIGWRMRIKGRATQSTLSGRGQFDLSDAIVVTATRRVVDGL